MSAAEQTAVNVRQQVSAEEWATRVDLAACYRLIAHFGWDDLVFTHISARVPGTHDFLINPYGLMFEEVTASNLVRVDLAGNKTLPSPYEINPAGYTIHSAVHEARDDAGCVLHLHTMEGIAVSAQQRGLLPISQQATFITLSLSYHDYEGLALNPDEKARLQAHLGDTRHMILRNHGLLTVGRTVSDAFLAMYSLQRACEIQIMAQAGGSAELINIPQAVLDTVPEYVRLVTRGAGAGLVWPALLRKMDRLDPGYRE
ncbi:class II aldolase/adducin family protein [Steroidobacter sp. S1-65]|uniref:Class II aldolase/adducin family protein n=1 Tax=Steroidobacter gossypii TaxID=2805490 RepID=A0ABS1X590_9GAMM|nr:class II aldolase/adducin family protein [Steroidobacter gossypii]MBM0108375.1 class II aldolase/adducin family protein [Steroidobacter gossypii]